MGHSVISHLLIIPAAKYLLTLAIPSIFRYIYKRLRFLRSTFLSQLALLYFLAAWHGLYFGYFIAFTIEMAVVFMENEVLILDRLSFNLILSK